MVPWYQVQKVLLGPRGHAWHVAHEARGLSSSLLLVLYYDIEPTNTMSIPGIILQGTLVH